MVLPESANQEERGGILSQSFTCATTLLNSIQIMHRSVLQFSHGGNCSQFFSQFSVRFLVLALWAGQLIGSKLRTRSKSNKVEYGQEITIFGEKSWRDFWYFAEAQFKLVDATVKGSHVVDYFSLMVRLQVAAKPFQKSGLAQG